MFGRSCRAEVRGLSQARRIVWDHALCCFVLVFTVLKDESVVAPR